MSRKKIVIIDDEEDLCHLMKTYFLELDHDVFLANTLGSGLLLMKEVSPDVVFRKQDYDSMVATIKDDLVRNGKITLAEARNLFGTSRKYAQALLEHLDAIGTTIRDGDFRKLRK